MDWRKILLIIVVIQMCMLGSAFAENWSEEADVKTALTYVWLILTGALVFLMHAGFAMLESGFTRQKNTVNILMKNIMNIAITGLIFWAVGYAIMFDRSNFFLANADSSTYNLWFFQMVFAATAATIVSGAVAERMKFSAFLLYVVWMGAIIYPIYGHWIWGGGFLSSDTSPIVKLLGVAAHDFAGSGVVHAVGGYAALIGAMLVGPRIGKFINGEPRAIPGHNIPLAALGAFLLAFGWIGFNAGSTLNALDKNFNLVVVNTMLASFAGAATAMLITWIKHKKPDVAFTINGLLAGLVSITAPCGSVDPWAAVVIGAIGGAIMYFGYMFNENRLKIDDPVGAIPVHGYAGTWGVLSVGIFSNGIEKLYAANAPGLIYGGINLFVMQFISVVVNIAWTVAMAYAGFKIIDKIVGLRMSKEEEMKGLDVVEHGTTAYPEFIPERIPEIVPKKSKRGEVVEEG